MIRNYLIDEESEVFKVSIVEHPAVETNMVYLSEQKPKYIQFESDERRMVYSCALRANFPIYRYDDYGEYYITFSPKVIEKLSQKFMKNGFGKNWSVDHETDVVGVVLTESWIKEDMTHDKSIALGLDNDIEVGSWFVGAKIENDSLWDMIKQGQWGGFSIEAECFLNEINFSKNYRQDMENNTTLLESIKQIILEALGKTEEKKVQLEEEVQEEQLEAVEEVQEEVKEEVVEEAVEETVDEEVIEEEVKEEVVEEPTIALSQYDELKAELEKVQAELSSLKAENNTLKETNEKLSKQPSTEPLKVDAKNHPSFLDFASGRIKY